MREIYFINVQGEKVGPIEICDIPQHPINGDTMVWHQGLPQWKKACEVPEVSAYIIPATPPPPQNQQPQYNGATQQQPYTTNTVNQKPDSYLWLSILTTVLCCLPLGIVAIIKSNQVESKWNIGDREGAMKSSKDALTFGLISAGLGVIGGIIGFIIGIAAG